MPVSVRPRLPVRTLTVEVIEGPDKGMKAEAQSETLTLGTGASNDVVLSDLTVSGFHLELSRSEAGVEVRDLGSTNGTYIGSCRLVQGLVTPGTTLSVGKSQVQVNDGAGTVVEVFEGDQFHDMLGRTPVMRRMMAQVQRVARTSVPVLVNGESGTGKELVARALHAHSQRASGPFVTVDCGSLSPTLVASELFGHERGAFTGAERQHQGAFERAHGGTLFLDELGELASELQPQLLGALERRRFRRVGGKQDVSVDVRVVTATNRDLRAEVNSGAFRMDLYFRIAVVELRLPPLRERKEDIAMLAAHFLREAGHSGPIEEVLSAEALDGLGSYRWPGNVRELRNWVEASLALGETPALIALGEDGGASADFGKCDPRILELAYKDARNLVLHKFEACYLENLMERTAGNVAGAARIAQMDRSYLIKLLQKHGLKIARDSSAPAS